MAQVSVRLKKLRIKESDLLEPGGAIYIAAQRAGEAAVDHVHDELLAMDAIDSGELYASIDYEIFRQGRGIVISVGPMKGDDAVKARAKYVEYGTRSPIPAAGPKPMPVKIKGGPFLILSRVKGQPAKPYLRTALKQVRDVDWSR
jgi:HK97 gp10 family phage protein